MIYEDDSRKNSSSLCAHVKRRNYGLNSAFRNISRAFRFLHGFALEFLTG